MPKYTEFSQFWIIRTISVQASRGPKILLPSHGRWHETYHGSCESMLVDGGPSHTSSLHPNDLRDTVAEAPVCRHVFTMVFTLLCAKCTQVAPGASRVEPEVTRCVQR